VRVVHIKTKIGFHVTTHISTRTKWEIGLLALEDQCPSAIVLISPASKDVRGTLT
jgi:hypothetical protein